VAYEDRRITIEDGTLSIGAYYFPWGTKRIPLAAVRSVTRIAMRGFGGKGRVWGTANPGYWANLDPRRPTKDIAFVVDAGRRVKPFVTPDDPDAFAAALQAAGVTVTDGGDAAPFV